MQNQDFTPHQERKLRFYEAGILFALILGIAIFVGVKMGGQGDEQVVEPVAVATADPVGAAPAETTTVAAPVVDIAPTVAPEPEPEPVVVTYAMAEKAYLDADYAAAAELFGHYTDEHAANAWGFYMLGLSEWKAGDAAAADEALAYAEELAPGHVKTLVNHARVLLDLDRVAEAEVRVTRALDQDPANADAQRVMGRVRHDQGRLDEAVACYESVLRSDSDDAWALNNLGLILIEQERFAEALPALAKAALLQQDTACIQNNLGVALERSGHYTAAASAYDRALELDATYAKAEASRARVGELSEAADMAPVDLEVVAAAFTVSPANAPATAAATAGTEPATGDMDVAAAVVATDAADTGDGDTGAATAGSRSADEDDDQRDR